MHWETTDVLFADTTDVLSADTEDVSSADTTDVLSADRRILCASSVRPRECSRRGSLPRKKNLCVHGGIPRRGLFSFKQRDAPKGTPRRGVRSAISTKP